MMESNEGNMEEFLNAVVPDSPACSPEKTPIATLVFFDLETTGLPGFIGKKNVQITELAMVAIDRSNFEDDTNLRAINKINIAIRPRHPVSYNASRITGLYNDMLQRQKLFDESVAKMLDAYFARLRLPLCLLAHNGDKYDFPLLQSELRRVGTSLPDNVMCADTLKAFHTFGHVSPSITNEVPLLERYTDNDKALQRLAVASNSTDTANRTNIEKPTMMCDSIQKTVYMQNSFEKMQMTHEEAITEELLNKDIEHFSVFDLPTEMTLYNKNNITPNMILDNGKLPPDYGEITPEKQIHSNTNGTFKSRSDDITKKVSRKSKSIPYNHNNFSSVKRKLYGDTSATVQMNGQQSSVTCGEGDSVVKTKPKRIGYSLEKLYTHYFGKEPEGGHYAENDCLHLCQVCQKVSNHFLPWLDENYMPFNQITAMW